MHRPLPSWHQLHPDDDPRVEERLMTYYRTAPAAEKLRRLDGLRRNAMAIALSGLRQRHPQADDAELRRRLASLLLGPELARRAYGPVPEAGDDAAASPKSA